MADRVFWPKALLEGLVIVVSILLAFGIDAWWAERQNRSAEREMLSLLRVEFTDNLEQFDGVEGRANERQFAASQLLYNTAQGLPVDAETLSVPNGALMRTLQQISFEGATPILDGLTGSGRLEIIRDPQVREAIQTWQHSLNELADYERETQSFIESQLRPALTLRGDVSHVLASAGSFGAVELVEPDSLTFLRFDEELKNLIASRFAYSNAIVRLRGRLADAADNLLIAISTAEGG